MKKIFAFLLVLMPSCVLGEEPLPDNEHSYVSDESEKPVSGHRNSGNSHETCAPLKKEFPNGMVLEIPVECHLYVNPYYDDDWMEKGDPRLRQDMEEKFQ